MTVLEYPKPGTPRNPKRPKFDARPDRFAEEVVFKTINPEIIKVTMVLRMTREERDEKGTGFLESIQEYLDK